MFQTHLILLLVIVLIIHIYSPNPVEETHAKIIAYAIFLSYYITSGNGKQPQRGLVGALLTWFYLLLLEKHYDGKTLYWGKALWYGLLWFYAYSVYPIKTQTIPIMLTALVLLLVNTGGPWKIDWSCIGFDSPPNTFIF
jgi:hypothetical protein